MRNLLLLFALIWSLEDIKALGHTNSDTAKAFFSEGEDAFFKYLSSTTIYPLWPKEECIGGVVYISFVITSDNLLDSIHVKRSVGFGLDEEAIRVIKLTNGKWTSAKVGGKPIGSNVLVPIKFNMKGCKAPSEKKLEMLREKYKEHLLNTPKSNSSR